MNDPMMVVYSCFSLCVFVLCLRVFAVDSLIVESCEFSQSSLQCYNGEAVNDTGDGSWKCECQPGWHGEFCQYCGGKIRLNETYGTVTDGPCEYPAHSECLWLLEAPSSDYVVHLRIRSLSLECGWDYLHVFSGDSLYSNKIAAFTGDVLEGDLVNDTNEATDFISLHVSGSIVLLYFYSDLAKELAGFHLEYWLGCPANCSNHGSCDANGSCDCTVGWTGKLCDQEACPSNCFGNGECDTETAKCICHELYTGVDCSNEVPFIHWNKLIDDSNSVANDSRQWGSGSHSNVQWNDSVWLFGGYLFGPSDTAAPLWRYGIDEQVLELVEPQRPWPSMRYSHSAVVYEDTMIIFGGLLVPSEKFTSEMWTYDFTDGSWSVKIWHPSSSVANGNNFTVMQNDSSNYTEVVYDYFSGDDSDGYDVSQELYNSTRNNSNNLMLPVLVRGHTAHIVGDRMLVFFGAVRSSEPFPSLVQELDLGNMTWSVPSLKGIIPSGRHGHTSVHIEELDVVYVYGGQSSNGINDILVAFNLTTYTWYSLSSSHQQPFLHSAVFIHHLMVIFGGVDLLESQEDLCFSNTVLTYDTVCKKWSKLVLSGSSLGISRRGHSAVATNKEITMLVFGGYDGQMRSDVLQIQFSNCSRLVNMTQCTMESIGMCGWDTQRNSCVIVSALASDQLELHCATVQCMLRRTYNMCLADDDDVNCQWKVGECIPLPFQPSSNSTVSDDPGTTVNHTEVTMEEDVCSRLSGCDVCLRAGCLYINNLCTSTGLRNESITMMQCLTTAVSCYDHTSCSTCTKNSCLWCSSLHRCVSGDVYPYVYPYGQCLGWQNGQQVSCPGFGSCRYESLSGCLADIGCGWCYSPQETGLGVCQRGGFSSPLDLCPPDWTWYFDEQPLCNCNGHSMCENGSVCDNCSDNTAGDHCEFCDFGYTGNPVNGQQCDECDCNGFGNACDNRTGHCICDDYGVKGDFCTNCSDGARGSIDNYCYYVLQVGYSYTIKIDKPHVQRASFITFPDTHDDLQFELELLNRGRLDLSISAGRVSRGLFLLENITNVTGPTTIFSKVTYTIKDDDFGDNDLGVLIFIDSMSPFVAFKVTLKQTNYLFLLYFFAAFCTCFMSLLFCFLVIWYARKRLAQRRFIRAYYRELRQRISRPFAKMNVLVSNKPSLEKQQASCVGVEPCSDKKAAVLSLLVQLPGETSTNAPRHGQPGLCFGSALVRSSRTASEIKQRSHHSSSTYRNLT